MEISPILLSKLLFFSILFGIFMGCLNDINRIVRVFLGERYSKRSFEKLYNFFRMSQEMPKKKNQTLFNTVIFFQDIIFMIMAAIGLVILNFYLNDGHFRVYTVFSAFIGFLIYFFTFGKAVIGVSEPIVIILRFAIITLVKMIIMPFKLFGLFVLRTNKKISYMIIKRLEKRTNIRYNNVKVKIYRELSASGFVSTSYKDCINEA